MGGEGKNEVKVSLEATDSLTIEPLEWSALPRLSRKKLFIFGSFLRMSDLCGCYAALLSALQEFMRIIHEDAIFPKFHKLVSVSD